MYWNIPEPIIWKNLLGQMYEDIDPINLSVFGQWEGSHQDNLNKGKI